MDLWSFEMMRTRPWVLGSELRLDTHYDCDDENPHDEGDSSLCPTVSK